MFREIISIQEVPLSVVIAHAVGNLSLSTWRVWQGQQLRHLRERAKKK
jgi:hypothetical protein